MPGVSERRSCQLLGVGRSGLHRSRREGPRRRTVEPPWVDRLQALIQQHPTFGYRQLWALLRSQEGLVINRKAVYRVLKLKR